MNDTYREPLVPYYATRFFTRSVRALFGWPASEITTPWAELCEHATPEPEDYAALTLKARVGGFDE